MARQRGHVVPFFQFVPDICRVIYTANAIESLNMVMHKLRRSPSICHDDESALKVLLLTVREASKNWESTHLRKPALLSFQLMFGEERGP